MFHLNSRAFNTHRTIKCLQYATLVNNEGLFLSQEFSYVNKHYRTFAAAKKEGEN